MSAEGVANPDRIRDVPPAFALRLTLEQAMLQILMVVPDLTGDQYAEVRKILERIK